jgi:glucose/arabinose dehydrogenase
VSDLPVHQAGVGFLLVRRFIMKLTLILSILLLLLLSACQPALVDRPIPSEVVPATSPTTAAEPVIVEPAPTATIVAPAEASGPMDAAVFPDPADFVWRPVVSGLERPLEIVPARDGTERLFLVEQTGKIYILLQDQLLPQPFLDLSERVSILRGNASEQGLLGLAFPPDFASSHVFYVNYTDQRGTSLTARYRVSADGNIADPTSEEVLLQIEQPAANHNGGGLQFGPDGYLYLSMGDGGDGGDPGNHGQNPNTLLGTLIRIDVSAPGVYTIPADNPFVQGGGAPEVWAYGLRNAWRFSFDRLTGDLYIADVGQSAWEEINYLPAGSSDGFNFGWNYLEGTYPYRGTPPENAILIDPVYEYDHSQGKSVTGGYVYRGQALPEWYGVYIFGDFISGRIWGMLPNEDYCRAVEELYQSGAYISSFGEDENGEIYFSDYRQGTIYRLERK